MMKKETIENQGHISVMPKEVMELLDPKPGEFIIDGTFGGGGHSKLIADTINKGRMLLVDRDETAYERAKGFKLKGIDTIAEFANYSDIKELLLKNNLPKADGILLDLGFSSLQLEEGRGFSFMKDEPLLMTYSDNQVPLKDLLRGMSKEEIANIIYNYSGERHTRKIADAIWKAEKKNNFATTGELVQIIKSVLPYKYEGGRINPATRTFLAFRIFANKEMEHLRKILNDLPDILTDNGRAVIITFQSLEDREVKEVFKELAKSGKIEILTKKPIPVSHEESYQNPRARSAKVRAARRVNNI